MLVLPSDYVTFTFDRWSTFFTVTSDDCAYLIKLKITDL